MKNKLKILIIPSDNHNYDLRMVIGLRDAFIEMGYLAHSLNQNLSPYQVYQYLLKNNFNIVIHINGSRSPEYILPNNIRYISWVQDVFPLSKPDYINSLTCDDILYTLGPAHSLGLDVNSNIFSDILYTGVSRDTVDKFSIKIKSLDFSLCGFIPKKINISDYFYRDLIYIFYRLFSGFFSLSRSEEFILFRYYIPGKNVNEVIELVSNLYNPLTGSLDISYLSSAIKKYLSESLFKDMDPFKESHILIKPVNTNNFLIENLYYKIHKRFNRNNLFNFVDYFSQTYPRAIDRILLGKMVLKISTNTEFYGTGWDSYPEFSKYSKGFLSHQYSLIDVYQKTRINLTNNTHGIGLHHRILECMAVGGFFVTHKSKSDLNTGGLYEYFEPNINYGEYTHDTFEENLKYWLSSEESRNKIAYLNHEIITSKHMWVNRAHKIINDLNL